MQRLKWGHKFRNNIVCVFVFVVYLALLNFFWNLGPGIQGFNMASGRVIFVFLYHIFVCVGV